MKPSKRLYRILYFTSRNLQREQSRLEHFIECGDKDLIPAVKAVASARYKVDESIRKHVAAYTEAKRK